VLEQKLKGVKTFEEKLTCKLKWEFETCFHAQRFDFSNELQKSSVNKSSAFALTVRTDGTL